MLILWQLEQEEDMDHPLRIWLQQPGRSQQALAKAVGCTQGLISQHLNWLEGKEKNASKVSAERAIKYEIATGHDVTKEQIRPDLFLPARGDLESRAA